MIRVLHKLPENREHLSNVPLGNSSTLSDDEEHDSYKLLPPVSQER